MAHPHLTSRSRPKARAHCCRNDIHQELTSDTPHNPKASNSFRHQSPIQFSLFVLASLVWLTPARVQAEVVWRGDFETGDLTAWDFALAPQSIEVVAERAVDGTQSAKITIHPEDLPTNNGHNRVELKHLFKSSTAEGSESYFGWSFYLPEATKTHNDIGYFESENTWQQRVALFVDPDANGSKLGGRINGKGPLPLGQVLEPGRWHRIVLHARWASDPAAGFVSIWLNGKQVVTRAPGATKADANPMFIQTGFHRDQSEPPVEVIFIDAAIEATTLAEAMVASGLLTQCQWVAQGGLPHKAARPKSPARPYPPSRRPRAWLSLGPALSRTRPIAPPTAS